MWWLLLVPLCVYSQTEEEIDLTTIRLLDKQLPTQIGNDSQGDIEFRRQNFRHRPPFRKVSLEKILKSEIEHGYIKAGKTLIRIEDNVAFKVAESFYTKFYRLEDDLGYKYIQSNEGKCLYKIRSTDFVTIKKELELYVPPTRYTPAPKNLTKADIDKKLKVLPEFSYYLSRVQGSFMRDLFNDENANEGISHQFGLNLSTKWQLPIKAGAAIHYEKATYDLRGGGEVAYSALSFGPQFKTKDFEVSEYTLRVQTQLRFSPFAKAFAQTTNGDVEFEFNAADFMLGLEHPISNDLGEFVVGVFYQQQWLNLKNQPEIVSIKASNETNKAFGLSLSQVFE